MCVCMYVCVCICIHTHTHTLNATNIFYWSYELFKLLGVVFI